MKIKQIIFVLFGLLIFSACSKGADYNVISEIEDQIVRGDYESAQSMSDDMIEDADLKEIPVKTLCRLSMVYAKLAERLQEEENMAKATNCYLAAIGINKDSVMTYTSELAVEDVQYAEMMQKLSDLIDTSRCVADYEGTIDESCERNEDNDSIK